MKEIEEIKWTSVRCGVNPCAGESVEDAVNVHLQYSAGGAKEGQKEHWTIQRTDCGGWGLEANVTVEPQARDLGKAKLSL